MRRAAAPAERGVQPGVDQRRHVRATAGGRGVGGRLDRARARGAAVGPVPRRRHRGQPVPAARRSTRPSRPTAGSASASWAGRISCSGWGSPTTASRRSTSGTGSWRSSTRRRTTSRRSSPRSAGPFPNWSRSIYKHGRPLRNSTVTTIAPTGTISMIAGCSSGVEPAFAVAFTHKVGDRVLPFTNPIFAEVARERGFYSDALMEEIAKRGRRPRPGRRAGGRPARLRDGARGVLRVARPAPGRLPEVHRQRGLQDHQPAQLGLRSTTWPAPTSWPGSWAASASPCSGTAARRASSTSAPSRAAPTSAARPRPRRRRRSSSPARGRLTGRTYRVETPLGTAYTVVNEHGDGEPFEVFVSVGKAGSDTMAVAEAMGRLISLALRMPSPLSTRRRLEEIVAQLSGIGGGRPLGFGPQRVLSLPDGIARVLAEHLGQVKVGGRGRAAGRARREARGGGHLPGVRSGDVRLRGRLQEVLRVRLQRVLSPAP